MLPARRARNRIPHAVLAFINSSVQLDLSRRLEGPQCNDQHDKRHRWTARTVARSALRANSGSATITADRRPLRRQQYPCELHFDTIAKTPPYSRLDARWSFGPPNPTVNVPGAAVVSTAGLPRTL